MSKTLCKTAKASSRRTTKLEPRADHAAKRPDPESPMARRDAAMKSKEDKIPERGKYRVFNLTAMHRAWGQPPGKDPWSWVKAAAPMVTAIHRYHGATDPRLLRCQPLGVLLPDGKDVPEFACPGDCETLHEEIAMTYICHLKGEVPVEYPLAGA